MSKQRWVNVRPRGLKGSPTKKKKRRGKKKRAFGVGSAIGRKTTQNPPHRSRHRGGEVPLPEAGTTRRGMTRRSRATSYSPAITGPAERERSMGLRARAEENEIKWRGQVYDPPDQGKGGNTRGRE